MLKTEAVGRGFQHLPRDLANVNAWKTMFDPYIEKDVKSQVIHSSINQIRMMSDNEKLSVKENYQAM